MRRTIRSSSISARALKDYVLARWLAIEPLQLRAQLDQYPGHDPIGLAQKMTLRSASFEVEESASAYGRRALL
jgi:hypothetical protein